MVLVNLCFYYNNENDKNDKNKLCDNYKPN